MENVKLEVSEGLHQAAPQSAYEAIEVDQTQADATTAATSALQEVGARPNEWPLPRVMSASPMGWPAFMDANGVEVKIGLNVYVNRRFDLPIDTGSTSLIFDMRPWDVISSMRSVVV